ncbi:MAG: septal ring lytic transglycosylase RlpA family protein [Gammaproteobacteria bacterium]|jgi:rare lipoprotein A|nr:septal ring lytic transglycosylase RlpA family protein [Gammaproteobacteria bacterium]
MLLAMLFAGCSSHGPLEPGDDAPKNPKDLSGIQDAVPRVEPRSRYGNPESYVVYGKRYYTKSSSAGYTERGIASWYGTKFHGRRTSSGEPYDIYKMTAAHKTLPLPTYAKVTNLRNGRSVVVKINDRGPFHANRIIDLSYAAAARLGIQEHGTGLVEVEAIDPSRTTPSTTARPATAAAPATLFLQVGAFSSRDNAVRLEKRLQSSGLGEIHILEASSTAGPMYRVRIGPLATVNDADRISNSLISQGISDTRVIID